MSKWMNRPLSNWWCGFGVLLAIAIFVGLVQLLGGPTVNDAYGSLFSTWAIAHGHLSCAYPTNAGGAPERAPLYPLFSGAFAAVTRIGHSVPFPTSVALGSNCSKASAAINTWSFRSGAMLATLRIGFLSFIVLAGGLVALLRSSGRGRCGWEPMAVVLLALLSPVFMCVQEHFHPEDLVAMGLALGALACVDRQRWIWAGILLGLALTSQQFVLLVIAPLIVTIPANGRVKLAASLVGAAALVSLPFVALSSGRAFGATIGMGNTPNVGRTVLAGLHLGGVAVFASSRLLPIALAMALALWMRHRLGPRLCEPLPLASLVGTSLALRLLFEVNLFGYYFMAVAVMLLVLDVLQGRISAYSIAWIAVVTLAFDPLFTANNGPPIWMWQLLLAPAAVALTIRPLISYVRDRSLSESGDHSSLVLRPTQFPLLQARVPAGSER